MTTGPPYLVTDDAPSALTQVRPRTARSHGWSPVHPPRTLPAREPLTRPPMASLLLRAPGRSCASDRRRVGCARRSQWGALVTQSTLDEHAQLLAKVKKLEEMVAAQSEVIEVLRMADRDPMNGSGRRANYDPNSRLGKALERKRVREEAADLVAASGLTARAAVGVLRDDNDLVEMLRPAHHIAEHGAYGSSARAGYRSLAASIAEDDVSYLKSLSDEASIAKFDEYLESRIDVRQPDNKRWLESIFPAYVDRLNARDFNPRDPGVLKHLMEKEPEYVQRRIAQLQQEQTKGTSRFARFAASDTILDVMDRDSDDDKVRTGWE